MKIKEYWLELIAIFALSFMGGVALRSLKNSARIQTIDSTNSTGVINLDGRTNTWKTNSETVTDWNTATQDHELLPGPH